MSVTPQTILASRLTAHGEPVRAESVELPQPGDGEVRVRLAYGGVNPVDGYIAAGRVAPDAPLPRTIGGEAAGTTADGTPVLVAGEGLGTARDGLWAQAANVPEGALHRLPDGVGAREAAAMGVSGLTSWHTVHGVARVTAEDRVLVLGAAGGVGSVIVSLASTTGAKVWGQTGTEAKAGLIAEQGAQRALVTGADGLAEALGDFQPTVVFDPLGGPFVAPIVAALAPRGRIVSFGTSAGPDVSFNLQILYRKSGAILGYGGMSLTGDERREGLRHALEALADGRLRVPIDRTFPLGEAAEALAYLSDRKARGNVLLELGGGS